MAQPLLLQTLSFFPNSTSSFSLLENPNLSLLSPRRTPSSLAATISKPLFPLRRTASAFRPIYCSSETLTVAAEIPPVEAVEEENSTTRLLAQNVPWTSTADEIRALFQNYGTVIDVELSMHNRTRNRGLVFVEMSSAEEAAEAFSKLEDFEYEGRKLKMNYAKPKKTKPSSPVQPKPPVLYNLFVANLSFEARAKHLKEFFESASCNVVSAEVIFTENPRKSAGYGFVSFNKKIEADEVLSAFQGKELLGRPIRLARSRRFVKLESEVNSEPEDGLDLQNTSIDDTEQPQTVDSS